MDHVRLEDLLNRHVDGDLTGEDRRELERMLLDSPDARGVFWRFARLNSLIRDNFQSQAGQRVAVGLPHQLDLESQIPSSPFPSLSTTHYPLPTSHFSVGSWAFSCMVATVIMGVMLLVFWAMKVTHHQHIAEAPSQSAPSETMPEMVFVGRITGMVDVKWSDDPHYLPPLGFAHVPLDRKYILSSGLLEITYDTGAKVILEGPCTYEVESTASGYLALGKLTARVGERGEGRGAREEKGSRSKVQGSRSKAEPSSFILHPSSLFSVRTPTAVVTDLGTEFGVEVSDEGNTTSHVFRGLVKVQVVGGTGLASGTPREVILGENESARVQPDKDAKDRLVIVRGAADPTAFAFVRPGQLAALAEERQLKPFRRWQAFSESLRKRSDLVAYYDFQQDKSERSTLRNRASSGSQLDGRIKGAVWASGRFPGKHALYFHGRNCGNRVALPEQERFQFAGPFSVAVWFKTDRFEGKWVVLVAKSDTSWRLQQHGDANALTFDTDLEFSSDRPKATMAGRTEVADGRWHLAVAVFEPGDDTTHKRLYLDGRLEAESRLPQPIHLRQNDEPVWLGDNSMRLDPSREFQGLIDEAAFFAAALSADEVAAMFQAGDPDHPPADGERR